MGIGDGGDIGDDQAADQIGFGQRKLHRRLAAHGMAQKIGRGADMADHLGQIGGKVGIAVAGGAGAFAVVAHVHRPDIADIGKAAGDHAPVPPRAEQAMRDDKRRRGHAVGIGGGAGGGVVDQLQHCFAFVTRSFPSARFFRPSLAAILPQSIKGY